MHGETLEELQIQYVPGQISIPDLERHAIRAYRQYYNGFEDPDETGDVRKTIQDIMAKLTGQGQT